MNGIKFKPKTRPRRVDIDTLGPRSKAIHNLPLRISAGFLEAELCRLGIHRSDNRKRVNIDATAALFGVGRTTVRNWLSTRTMIPERVAFELNEFSFEIANECPGQMVSVEVCENLRNEHGLRIASFIESQDVRSLRDQFDRGDFVQRRRMTGNVDSMQHDGVPSAIRFDRCL